MPSSTNISVAAAVIGLVIEAMRNRVSGRIGGPSSDCAPAATTSLASPSPTRTTMPAAKPFATRRSIAWRTRSMVRFKVVDCGMLHLTPVTAEGRVGAAASDAALVRLRR